MYLLINMKMPTIVGIFIFISRENFMLSWPLTKFYNLGALKVKRFDPSPQPWEILQAFETTGAPRVT